MPQVVIRTRLSPEQVRRAVAALPAVASGRSLPAEGRPLQRALGETLLGLIRRAFLAKSSGGVDDAGGRWAPLAASAVRGKGGRAILQRSGRLLGSFDERAIDARPGRVAVFTDVPYARWQHEGTRTIPARRLWPEPARWPSAWWAELGETLRQGLLGVLGRMLGGA